jgi:RPA family protein
MSVRRRRAPAIKLKIGDLVNGKVITEQDGSRMVEIKTADKVKRARIIGEITDKAVIESDESVLMDLEDETGTIKVKGGGNNWSGQIYLEMKGLKEGLTVDLIGLVRETPEGQLYLEAELCFPVTDQAVKVLRELEISQYYAQKGLVSDATSNIESAIKEQAVLNESDEIKDNILELLRKEENLESGCSFDQIKKALNLNTKQLEPELRALQSDGEIFEPIPGTFKYV